jgi:hypothetical protein
MLIATTPPTTPPITGPTLTGGVVSRTGAAVAVGRNGPSPAACVLEVDITADVGAWLVETPLLVSVVPMAIWPWAVAEVIEFTEADADEVMDANKVADTEEGRDANERADADENRNADDDEDGLAEELGRFVIEMTAAIEAIASNVVDSETDAAVSIVVDMFADSLVDMDAEMVEGFGVCVEAVDVEPSVFVDITTDVLLVCD